MSLLAHLRERAAIQCRRLLAGGIRRLRGLVARTKGGAVEVGARPVAVLLGAGAGRQDAADALNRVAWYLGENGAGPGVREVPAVTLVGPSTLSGVDAVSGLEAPATQRDYLEVLPPVRYRSRHAFDPDEYSAFLVRDVRDLVRMGILSRLNRVRLVDELLYSGVASGEYRDLAVSLMRDDGWRELDETSRRNFGRMRRRASETDETLTLGTGPSVDGLSGDEGRGRAVIVCNSLVRNHDLLEKLRPIAVCFSDPVFHFGPSEYAARFRQDLVEVVTALDAFAVTNRADAALLLAHRPELRERIVVLEPDAGSWRIPVPEDPRIRPTQNILTHLMLPLACSLAGRVAVGGCDGREPSEDYFWQHADTAQYEGLMQTAFETHPSFFRDRIYADYYRRHCRELEEQLGAFEKRGREFVGVTPSHIPALARRARPGLDAS